MRTASRRRAAVAVSALITVVFFASPGSAQTPAGDEGTLESLPNYPGREETFGYCVGCHSFSVVSRQGMDRGRWADTLSWMTEKHNMPAPDADVRKVILDYLAQAYPSKEPSRSGGWANPFAPQR